jgi:hypothetical protein
MGRREMARGALRFAAAVAAVAAVAGMLGGCGGERTTVFESQGVAVEMKLPEGWRRGEPRAAGGYTPSSRGGFFFEKSDADNPSGDVMVFPMEGESLEAYVDTVQKQVEGMEALQLAMLSKLDKATGGGAAGEIGAAKREVEAVTATKRAYKMGELDAVEVFTTTQRSTLTVYARKGDKVAVITYGAEKADFPRVEKAIRESAATISVR